MTNPDLMSGMMKQNLSGIVPQVINHLLACTQTAVATSNELQSLKHNLAKSVFVLQIVMGTFVSYFFSGFILGKIPFPLSPSFRLMLQASSHPDPKSSPSFQQELHMCWR